MEKPVRYERFRADGVVSGGTHRVIVRSDDEDASQVMCEAVRDVFVKYHLRGAKGESLRLMNGDVPYYLDYEKLS